MLQGVPATHVHTPLAGEIGKLLEDRDRMQSLVTFIVRLTTVLTN